jgi:ATP:ADP antiporter, AAA family
MYLQVYGVLPAATLFMVVYSKLSTRLSARQLFYAAAAPFFAFFTLFGTVLYPLRALLHPAAAALDVPQGLSYVTTLYRHWTYALFCKYMCILNKSNNVLLYRLLVLKEV